MNDKSNAPARAHIAYTRDSRDADRLRELIGNAGLSQRAAARELGVDERTMRYWCSGDQTPPTMAFRGLDPFVRHRENLARMIESNEDQIAAIKSGKITGMGYGESFADPSSAAAEIARLVRKNEELRPSATARRGLGAKTGGVCRIGRPTVYAAGHWSDKRRGRCRTRRELG